MVEIRIPTFKNPEGLNRALESLVFQRGAMWRVIILDDDPDGSAMQVLEDHAAGSHQFYQQNEKPLGKLGNLAAAFQPEPFLEDSTFACVLQDDQTFETTVLGENIAKLEATKEDVLVRNTIIESDEETPQNSLKRTFGKNQRYIPYRERLVRAVNQPTISNLGLFWRLNAGIDLSNTEEPHSPALDEQLRGLRHSGDLLYVPTPLATEPLNSSPEDQQQDHLAHLRFIRLVWPEFTESERNHIFSEARRLDTETQLQSLLDETGLNQPTGFLSKITGKFSGKKAPQDPTPAPSPLPTKIDGNDIF